MSVFAKRHADRLQSVGSGEAKVEWHCSGARMKMSLAMATLQIVVNARPRMVAVAAETPLLYVLQNELQLHGPRFGCGLAQCGSCSVLIDGVEKRSCVTPVSAVIDKSVTTLEGLPMWYAVTRGFSHAPEMHPMQQALIEEQAPQCGYCYNGMIVKAAELLSKNPTPTESQIRTAMNGHLCRCGTYPSIIRAVGRASDLMASAEAQR
jgi:aerobic-type carbon monoxide dehydrogenase small subunit (CoxS/CutS family)